MVRKSLDWMVRWMKRRVDLLEIESPHLESMLMRFMHEYITIILDGCIVPWSTRKVGEDWDVDVKKENDGNNIFMRKLKVEGVDEGFRVEVP